MNNLLSGGRVHIIGIGGIGMSAIGEVMASRGIPVQGSDQKDGANLRRLSEAGLKVFVGHQAANVEGADAVVCSTAVKDDNPEMRAARALGLPIHSRASALAALMQGYRTVSVTGSHGKTTTTSMIAWMFEKAGLDPTALVGGILPGWNSNVRIGNSRWMVVEADESDATFIKLPTEIGVVTNIDPEHLDYYGTEAALHDAFRTFLTQIPAHGLAVVGIDHPVVRRILSEARAENPALNVVTYGFADDADVKVVNAVTNGGVTFEAVFTWRGEARRLPVSVKVPGLHNAANAAAAIAVGLRAGLSAEAAIEALGTFQGVDRRFTKTGTWKGVSIYDDYAHHPVEIEAVLSAARGMTRGRIIAVMQPHRYSRLASCFEGFSQCFKLADCVLITPVYAAGEQPNGYDRDRLVEGIRLSGQTRVMGIDDEQMLVATVASLARPGDMVIGLGAGTITDWARALPQHLEAYAFAGAAE